MDGIARRDHQRAGGDRNRGEDVEQNGLDDHRPILALSARFRGEREGTRRASGGEGGVGGGAVRSRGSPGLTPTLSPPRGGEGEYKAVWAIASPIRGVERHVLG